MAFEKSDAANLAALKAEVETDPTGMGYAAAIDVTAQLLKLLNDADNNTGTETANQTLTVGNLLSAIVPDDFDHVQVSDGERRYIEAFLGRDFNEVIESYRSQIRDAFRTNSQTVTNIDAMIRPLSRAEVLFDAGTVLSRTDWIAARDS